jgi:hypothetical protein
MQNTNNAITTKVAATLATTLAARARSTLMLGCLVLTSSFSVLATGTNVEFNMLQPVAQTKVVSEDDENPTTTDYSGLMSCQIVCSDFPRCR